MCRALVQIGDQHWDRTAGRPLHGDVISLHPDGHDFGGKELEGRRVVELPDTVEDWQALLDPGNAPGCVPLYRAFFIDDDGTVQRRPTTPLEL